MPNFLDEQGLARFWNHILNKLGNKVDKVDGKVLTTNDYTNEDKQSLSGAIESINEINVALEEISEDISDEVIDEICGGTIEEAIVASLDVYNGEAEEA